MSKADAHTWSGGIKHCKVAKNPVTYCYKRSVKPNKSLQGNSLISWMVLPLDN